MFSQQEQQMLAALALDHGLERAAVLAVTEVETGGMAYARVNGRDEPLIRFEGHYFHRLLPAIKRAKAVVEGLAHARAGAVRNPRSQASRWKLLERARAIDRPAALESTSWGVGQVMGAHWRWLGYASIEAMVETARRDLEGQVEIMLRFIDKAGLKPLVEARDWAGFARAYNGPAYKTNHYDEKLAKAFVRHGGEPPQKIRHALATLRLGSKGDAVEDLQRWLRQMGYPLIADGDFGFATQSALKEFQTANGLVSDGIAGARTLEALHRRLPRAG